MERAGPPTPSGEVNPNGRQRRARAESPHASSIETGDVNAVHGRADELQFKSSIRIRARGGIVVAVFKKIRGARLHLEARLRPSRGVDDAPAHGPRIGQPQ